MRRTVFETSLGEFFIDMNNGVFIFQSGVCKRFCAFSTSDIRLGIFKFLLIISE